MQRFGAQMQLRFTDIGEKNDPKMVNSSRKKEKIITPVETKSVQKSFTKQVNLLPKEKVKSADFLLPLRSLDCQI